MVRFSGQAINGQWSVMNTSGLDCWPLITLMLLLMPLLLLLMLHDKLPVVNGHW